jgi:hypothetical protein
MKYIYSLVLLMIFGQIFSFYDFCPFGRCGRRRRRCHRRFGCGFRGWDRGDRWGNNDVDIDNVAVADSNAIAINTGDFGDANAFSSSNAFNVNDIN